MKALLCLTLLVFHAAAAAAVTAVIEPAELEVGEPGVCLTEMDGGELVEIPLVILGVAAGTSPEGEIVLVRLQGERFEETGIIAGMSGSPVYVRDRLLGALAFGWAFSKEPIGGVTPFVRMQQLSEKRGGLAPVGGQRPQLSSILEEARTGDLGAMVAEWLMPERERGTGHLPLAVSVSPAMMPRGAGWLTDSWERFGWVSVPGGAAVGGATPREIAPGSMISAVMVDGDATLAASGTVTAVEGKQVWAFGHPFLGGGSVSMPLAQSQVIATLASAYSSFKISAVGDVVGALETDRAHGIWGELGETAPMIPVDVRVGERSFAFRSIRHPLLLPYLVGYLTAGSQAAHGRTFGFQSIRTSIALEYAGGDRAAIAEHFAAEDAPARAAAYAAAVVGYLENSPFELPELQGIRVELDSSEQVEQIRIVDVVPERPVVRPGESLGVRVRMRPFRGAEFSRRLTVDIPASARKGRLELIVADGASWSAYDLQMRPPRAASFADERRLLDRIVPSNRLVLALEKRETGVTLSGGSVAAPVGVLIALQSGLGRNLTTTPYRVLRRVEEELEAPLLGAQRIALTVRIDGDDDEKRGENP